MPSPRYPNPANVPTEHGGGRAPFRISLHWKLFLTVAAFTAASLLAAYFVAVSRIQQEILEETEGALLHDALIAEEALVSPPGKPEAGWVDAEADRLGRVLGVRVTVIAKDGTVMGDSELSGGDLLRMGNQSERTEVRLARERGAGSATLRSAPERPDVLQVAKLLGDGPIQGAIVRLGAPLGRFEEARSKLRKDLLLLGAALLVAISLLSVFLTRSAREDLDAIVQATLQFGSGEFGASLPKTRPDEIGDLARGLGGMAQRFRETIQDVTQERNQLQAMLEAMEEGVLVTDAEGRVILANRALLELFDLPRDPRGLMILELVRSPELHDLVPSALKDGTPQSREISLRRRNEERQLLVRAVPIAGASGSSGAVAVFHDISELRRAEKMRRDFVANVSHELKTPLAAIRGYAETLAEVPPEDAHRTMSFSQTILRHAERLNTLVEDLLELSKIERGEAALKLEAVPLQPCVEQVLQAIRPIAQRKRISTKFRIAPSLPFLRADAVALQTVLENLVDNAVKYAPEGGWVEIRARVGDGMVRIEVADSGPGIAPEHLGRLFERFYRVDAARSREQGGTGLGLAIVKHLAQALGGQVGVESEMGQGSIFHVMLPTYGKPEAE